MKKREDHHYFLKSVGFVKNALPVRWWEERPEVVNGIFFKSQPPAIHVRDTLIYYAVGGDGRLCGVVTVTGEGSESFERPASWTPEMRGQLHWRMPVRLLHKCTADRSAPRLAEFHDRRIGQGSYQSIDDEKAERIIDRIVAVEEG